MSHLVFSVSTKPFHTENCPLIPLLSHCWKRDQAVWRKQGWAFRAEPCYSCSCSPGPARGAVLALLSCPLKCALHPFRQALGWYLKKILFASQEAKKREHHLLCIIKEHSWQTLINQLGRAGSGTTHHTAPQLRAARSTASWWWQVAPSL